MMEKRFIVGDKSYVTRWDNGTMRDALNRMGFTLNDFFSKLAENKFTLTEFETFIVYALMRGADLSDEEAWSIIDKREPSELTDTIEFIVAALSEYMPASEKKKKMIPKS
jgi:hypothetical protein